MAVAIAGFLSGGYVASVLCAPLLGGSGIAYPGAWLCFVIGGVLGAVLMLAFFNWALIILSSLSGAHLIFRGLTGLDTKHGARALLHGFLARPHYASILFLILVIIGIAVQAAMYRRPAPAKA